jgi:hypothetical protein
MIISAEHQCPVTMGSGKHRGNPVTESWRSIPASKFLLFSGVFRSVPAVRH